MESGLHTITGNDQLSGWMKKKLLSTSQSQTYTKIGHCHRFVVCCGSDPVQLEIEKLLDLRSMLSKSMKCTKNCNICSWLLSTKWAQFFSMITPNHRSHNQRFKNWTSWANKVLTHSPYSTDLSPSNYLFFMHLKSFLWGKHFHDASTRRSQKCVLRVHWILKHGFSCYRNMHTYFLLSKKCVDCTDFYFD